MATPPREGPPFLLPVDSRLIKGMTEEKGPASARSRKAPPYRRTRYYVRRFDLEHAIRFLKQTLGWSAPRVRHPEQADRWTWLVLAAYAQLRLARSCAEDRRLPWERPQRQRRLTPCWTLRGFAALLAAVGTPAREPKPCGRSPGRPKGHLSGRAKRYPALKKGV